MSLTKITENNCPFWEKNAVPGNNTYNGCRAKWQVNVPSKYKQGKKLHDEGAKQMIAQFECKAQIVSWSNIETSEVLCCRFPSRQNIRQDHFCMEDIRTSTTTIQLQKNRQKN